MGLREAWTALKSALPPEAKAVSLAEAVAQTPKFYSDSSSLYTQDAGVPVTSYTPSFADPGAFYATQPNLRTVVDFAARNVAGIPLHLYERRSEEDRPRVRGTLLASLLTDPSRSESSFRFWENLVRDSLLYGYWAIYVAFDGQGPHLIRLASARLSFSTNILGLVETVKFNGVDLALEDLIFDAGYSPSGGVGLSPVQALAQTLQERVEAGHWRRQRWQGAPRLSGWLSRGLDAPEWDLEDRKAFQDEFHANYSGHGPYAGRIPLLEEGMAFHQESTLMPKEMEDVEARKLTFSEVAAAFHIPPELVGAREGTFSNVREYRQSLYRDALGPVIQGLEAALNKKLLPRFAEGKPLYIEANLEAKLRGSFEEQAQILQASVGGPYMTRNEARAKLNMRSLEGGDELIVPLNVVEGGQASPQDSGSQNLGPKMAVLRVKSPGAEEETPLEGALAKFVARQEKSVLSALGAKASGAWWDKERWDAELKTDLLPFLKEAAGAGAAAAKRLDEDLLYEVESLGGWVDEVAFNEAAQFNEATRASLEEVQGASEGWAKAAAGTFAVAATRAKTLAATATTEALNFGTFDALRASERTVTKTWRTNSPDSRHARLNGKTVALQEKFSNGARFPGDAILGAGERAHCKCSIEYKTED